MRAKEIGGYYELERYGATAYHSGALALNTGRNALRYAIRALGIKAIHAPHYTCPVVWDVLRQENCKVTFYDITEALVPAACFPKGAFVLVNNWFGVCDENIAALAAQYERLMIDNAQSFYSPAVGLASFYSPRKFFGLPDGGLLVSRHRLTEKLEKDISYERTTHLLKRHDLGANAGYPDFTLNERMLSALPMMEMSNLTLALMENINYKRARQSRLANAQYLHKELSALNELSLNLGDASCPMVYPLLIGRPGLRKKLIAAHIYVAQYWDFSGCGVPEHSFSAYLSEYLLPLPVDQRYGIDDMQRVVRAVKETLRE